MRKTLVNILKFILSLGLGVMLVWLALRNLSPQDIEKMQDAFVRTNYYWLVPGLAVGMLSNVIRAYRWRLLLNAIGYNPKIGNTIYAVMVMYLGNLVFPRLGEVSRCALLARYENIPIQKSIGTMITERIVDVISMLLIGVYLFFAEYDVLSNFFEQTIFKSKSHSDTSMLKWVIMLLGLFLAIAVWFLLKRFKSHAFVRSIIEKIEGLLEGAKSIFKLKNAWLFIFYSIMVWLCYTLMIYICYQALVETSNASFNSALTLVFFGGIAFIATQGGIGSYPLAVQAVLVLYGIAGVIGYTFGWIVWGVQTVLVIAVGLLSLVLISVTNKATAQSEYKQ
ncbi:MAG: flippase-like domain-containing protein [Chitinophagales bacterium]|nr:flippase-like domain-containing protein [Chitinophagales bacterium]HRP39236.1 lysylphosphatidylglycerol synthase transmembrane domain-containing protein [Chitinophagales bacterium]